MTSTSSPENSDTENGSEVSISFDSDLIDHETFEQLLGMDDEEDSEFSLSIVQNYYKQARETFNKMEKALKKEDLEELSKLGHFLKGSSAAIGLTKVKDSCEKIQHHGDKKDESGIRDITEEDALIRISELLVQVNLEYREAEAYLQRFYEKRNQGEKLID